MSAEAFVDTNILVYAHDARGGEKTLRAQKLLGELWQGKRGAVSTQVLQEFCINVRRNFVEPMRLEQVQQVIQLYREWHVIVNTTQSILRALELEKKYSLSFWDAMIVQAAQSAGCEILYSEDLSHGQEYDGVLVVNPFTA